MRSEVDDAVDVLSTLEHVGQTLSVATVHFVHHEWAVDQRLNAVEDAALGRAEIVYDDRLVARTSELDHGVGANVPCSTRHDNLLH
jgi:hypothetical protein